MQISEWLKLLSGAGIALDEGGGTGSPAVKPVVDPPRMYTQEQLDAKLRGKGSESDRHAADAEKWKAEVDKLHLDQKERDDAAAVKRGEFEALYTAEKEKTATLEESHNKLVASETKRQATLIKANKDRQKELPENLRGLVPAGIDPDECALHLAKLEAMTGASAKLPAGTGVRPPDAAEETYEQFVESSHAANEAAMTGKPSPNSERGAAS